MFQFANIWTDVYRLFGENGFYLDVIGSNLVSAGVFWILCSFLFVVDLTGKPAWLLKYKTQPGKNQPVEKQKLLKAIRVALFNQTFVSLPIAIFVYWIKSTLGAPYKPEDLPSFLIVVRDLAACVVVEEIGFYYTHRLFHWGPFYQAIHKQHHEWSAPTGVISVYCHPIEYAVSNITPFVLGPILMRSHLATAWLWYSLAVTTTIYSHSGYHLPFLPSSEFHDYHHFKFTDNYGVLGWLDYLHGTDKQFRKSVQYQRHYCSLTLTPLNELHPAADKKQQ